MHENLTILKKGLILVALPFVLQLAFIALVLKINADGARVQAWALHTKEVIAKAEGTFRRLIEAQNGVAGLVLTHNPAYSDVCERALREVPGDLRRLRALVADNAPQRAKAERIAARAEALLAWQRALRRLLESGDRAAAAAEIQSLRGKTLLDDLRAATDDFLAEEERLDQERTRDLSRMSRQQIAAIAVSGLTGVVLVAVLAALFSRGIGRRFAVLADNAQRFAEGKELAAPLSGRDEIARVDHAFHAMARAIAEKNRENELFIYSVSHDLRSPLVNLQGFSQELAHAGKDLRALLDEAALPDALRGRARRLLEHDVDASIRFIQSAVARLSAIIDSLLRLSRAGRVEYRWQAVDVAATVGRVVEALGATIAERGATVTVGDLPPAWGDPTAVEQIFANLVGNAVNYLDPARPGVVEIGAGDDVRLGPASLHCYYVKDNGLGIPESARPKLFLAFQRFHAGSATGEGIGLALVRRIVERHGGQIRVESEAGAGSTFSVTLPAPPPEGQPAPVPAPAFKPSKEFA